MHICLRSLDWLGRRPSPPFEKRIHMAETAFLTDVKTLRERARKSLDDGAVTSNYQGDAEKAVELLQVVVATELVCVLRYTMHSIAVAGITSESVGAEFAEHAESERGHMLGGGGAYRSVGRRAEFRSGRPRVAVRNRIWRGRQTWCRW